MRGGRYLFDVGVTALAHAGTPVSGTALDYVRRAIRGDIQAIVPYASLVGAHHVLTGVYGFSSGDAAAILTRFMDAKRIDWHGGMTEGLLRDGLELAGEHGIDGWDGYYTAVAIDEGAGTVLTLDDDFERLDAFETQLVLSPEEFATLNDYLGY